MAVRGARYRGGFGQQQCEELRVAAAGASLLQRTATGSCPWRREDLGAAAGSGRRRRAQVSIGARIQSPQQRRAKGGVPRRSRTLGAAASLKSASFRGGGVRGGRELQWKARRQGATASSTHWQRKQGRRGQLWRGFLHIFMPCGATPRGMDLSGTTQQVQGGRF